jgi:excisionase family DNA binding protein
MGGKMKKLLDIREIADLLHLSVHKLYRLTAKNQIPMIRIGKKCLFDPDQLEKWVQSQFVEPAAR